MSYTEKQRRFMGAALGRARAGKKTRTGMSETQLAEAASKPLKKKKPKMSSRKAKKSNRK